VKSLADLTLEHCDKLRELAAQADSVVEFGMRHGVSTVALLAGQPKQMISYDLHQDPVAELLKSRQGATAFSFVQGDSLSVDIEPCNVLFTDRPRTDLDRAQMPRCLQR
jgi:cephalosporin hydroxylase